MALDSRYITTVSLEEYLIDKDTGQPLAFGTITFWQDNDRVTTKLVYELTGAPPNYTYTPLPNPITLSAVGTPSDNNGNNVSIYYFPYDVLGNLQLYYIEIKNQLGILQKTLQAWPNTAATDNPANTPNSIVNALSNPQFAQVNFSAPNNPLTINYVGNAIDTIAIAPDWDLIINHTNNGSMTVARTAVQGVSAYPGNPPYTLTLTPGLNIAALQLRQRLTNNPDIFSPGPGGVNGYISASILLAPLSSILSITYAPNDIDAQTQVLLTANNVSGQYTNYTNTVQLNPAINVNTGDNGFVDIFINLPIVAATTISNVQIVGLNSNIQGISYEQTPVRRQIDQLFNYYSPLLQYKPIPSYLIGWDFYYNPTQFLGPTLAASGAGANTSRYVWDQTIVFQSANNGPAISRAPSGALRITATNATQFALIQYLPTATARKILNDSISSMVTALTPQGGGLVSTISLWYTTDANLPSCAANNSIVATLDANGKPATFNGNWTEVPRNGLGNATLTIGNSANTNFNDYGFNGWDANGIAGVNTATWFAIVVGTAILNATQTVDFQSISLVPGNIPTIPAPQSQAEVLADCQAFVEMSFNQGIVPQQNINNFTSGMLGFPVPNYTRGGQPFALMYSIYFKVSKILIPTTVITYNPLAANAQIRNITFGQDTAGTTTQYLSKNGFSLSVTSVGANYQSADIYGIYWLALARLGE